MMHYFANAFARVSFAILTIILSIGASHALANSYAIATAGYSSVDTQVDDDGDLGYSVALGYQIHRQWYVEGGYLSLIDAEGDEQEVTANGAYLALLGKAGSNTGELYYKLGVAHIDIEYISVSETTCDGAVFCGYDDSVIAGLAGLGFDYYVGLESMVRLEYVYLGGEDDFSSHSMNLGFRYNF